MSCKNVRELDLFSIFSNEKEMTNAESPGGRFGSDDSTLNTSTKSCGPCGILQTHSKDFVFSALTKWIILLSRPNPHFH